MIKLIKSSFFNESETKKKLADFILSSEIFSMGVECRKFEEVFAEKQGRKYAVLVNSGSSANLALIQALLNQGILKKGDRIGFSALTWATNVMPFFQLGLEPVPLDCEIGSLNVSPEILRQNAKNIDALFLTNVLGFADDISEIKKICQEEKIVFLEDNCESLGSIAKGVRLGNFGLASTFSFFIGHHLSTIEGGMICTDDQSLYEGLVMVRAHGWDRNLQADSRDKLREKFSIDPFFSKYTFYDLSFNIRPTEITGLLGSSQIGYWDEIVAKRQANFLRFSAAASRNSKIKPLSFANLEVISNFAMPVIFSDAGDFVFYKDKFEKADVEIRPIIAGNIVTQPFYKKYQNKEWSLPNSDFIGQRGFYFGNNPEMTESEVDFLCDLLDK